MTIDTIIYERKNAQTRIALLGNGELKELEINNENKAEEGSIYLGRVSRKIELANDKIGFFINLGDGLEAFLNAEEPGLNELNITEGSSLVVQVAQERRAEKSPKVVRALQIVGENLVYCPYRLTVEISSKINDASKAKEYRELVIENTTGQEGWILRTSSVEATPEEIASEMATLRQTYDDARAAARKLTAPALLLSKPNPLYAYINKHQATLDKVVVNSHHLETEISEHNGAEFKVEYMADSFKEYGLEDAIAEALNKSINLKSGGRVIIEETRACVSIDVDSGDDRANGNISRLNTEAAIEIARQIRLRNLSGKIIIDFAGTSDYRYLKNVIETLEKELEKDYSKSTVFGLSRGGNVEVVRLRKRPSLQDLLSIECECCQGTGRVMR